MATLQGITGTIFAGMITCTDARLRKTGNSLALPVTKQCAVVVTIGANYANAVNREAVRQDGAAEFTAGALPKGRNWLVIGKVLVSDDGNKLYLRTQATPRQRKGASFARVLNYRDASGKFVSRADVAPFLPPKYESAKQQAQTGIGETISVRDYLFTSIRTIRLNGESYRLVA